MSERGRAHIDSIFNAHRAQNTRALMPFVCAGQPDLETTQRTLPALEEGGASIVEVGFPFSDPIADGPVIAGAMHRALEAGVTPAGVIDAVARARDDTSLGIIAMVSVSIVERIGRERFVARCAEAGFDGFIFPDLPLEESGELLDFVRAHGLCASLLVAPSTPTERARDIAAACSGFVYVLARAGITGSGGEVDATGIRQRTEQLRAVTDLPLAVGFGISSADHVRAVVEHADAAIVGSALVKRIADAVADGSDPVAAANAFVRELSAGLPAPA
ncbi:MAG: tryptophan synthase subunit alpha [Planctomycetota bacterium]